MLENSFHRVLGLARGDGSAGASAGAEVEWTDETMRLERKDIQTFLAVLNSQRIYSM